MSLKTERIYESQTVILILSDPDILDRIREDRADMSNLVCPMVPEWHWIGFYVGRDLIGCGLFHPDNMTTMKYHIHVLPEYRSEYAYCCGVCTIEYFIKKLPEYHKLSVVIPVQHKDTYHFTKKFGFKDEGVNRKSFMRDGVLHDQYMLGITRKEAERWQLQQ